MARNRPSDRDRLLKLIDGGVEAEKELRHGSLSSSAQQIRHHWYQMREEFKSRFSSPQGESSDAPALLFLVVNKILMSAILLILIYVVADFVKNIFYPQTVPATSHTIPAGEVPEPMPLTESSASYAKLVGLFESSKSGESSSGQLLPMDVTGLKLVGVDWGGEEPVALIEDTQSGKTFFKKKGEAVNEYHISEILRKKVVLTSSGQVVEIQ
jgi:hypothetical protein